MYEEAKLILFIRIERRQFMQLLSNWQDDLIWCPSQCKIQAEHDGKKFELYLRWRHEDPWQGHVIENAAFDESWDGDWSPDLFLKYDYFFKQDDNLDKIKSALIICAERWFKEG